MAVPTTQLHIADSQLESAKNNHADQNHHIITVTVSTENLSY